MAPWAGVGVKDPSGSCIPRILLNSCCLQCSGEQWGGQLGKGLSMFLTLISAMSVRGWGDAKKSKILGISQKRKEEAGV